MVVLTDAGQTVMHLAQLADERGEAMDTSAASPGPCMQAPTVLHQQSTEAALARYYLLSEQARDIILFIRQDGRIVDMIQVEKNRARRYESASQLSTDLAHYLAHEPISAPHEKIGVIFQEPRSRHWD